MKLNETQSNKLQIEEARKFTEQQVRPEKTMLAVFGIWYFVLAVLILIIPLPWVRPVCCVVLCGCGVVRFVALLVLARD